MGTQTTTEPFTAAEIDFLAAQPLGRLATIAPDGVPQNNPVSFSYNAEIGTIDIGGHNMGRSRKYRNLATNDRIAFVVDTIASFRPWRVQGIEIRGRAETLTGQPALMPGFSDEIIRIHPTRILSWGVDPANDGMRARNVG